MPETTYTITKKIAVPQPETTLHPSLSVYETQTSRNVGEVLTTLNTEVQSIKEHFAALQEKAKAIEVEFNSLDAIQILGSIETKIDAFIRRYDTALSKAEANMELERKVLDKLLGNAGQV